MLSCLFVIRVYSPADRRRQTVCNGTRVDQRVVPGIIVGGVVIQPNTTINVTVANCTTYPVRRLVAVEMSAFALIPPPPVDSVVYQAVT